METRIRRTFDYAFDPATAEYPAGGVPRLEFHRIGPTPFTVLGAEITPILLEHGRYEVLGFRVGDVAYCTDTNGIPSQSVAQLQNLDVLILDALRDTPHATHFSLQEALQTAIDLEPERAYFTHICHKLEHQSVSDGLPDHFELAYDGLSISLNGQS